MATTTVQGQPINKIERAHQMYRDGRYEEALSFYTEALAMAKTKAQRIALHSNRAACYLKLHDFKMAADECSAVLELDHKHTGALMLRAQTLVTLNEYQSALFDVNRLIELNPSSEVYQNLQARLKTQLSLAPIPEDEEEQEEDEDEDELEQVDRKEQDDEEEMESDAKDVLTDQNDNFEHATLTTEVPISQTQKHENEKIASNVEAMSSQTQSTKQLPEQHSSAWQSIPKPKGHSHLDYSRWDRVEDDSSEEDDDDEDEDEGSLPRYRFRVRTVGVQPVK